MLAEALGKVPGFLRSPHKAFGKEAKSDVSEAYIYLLLLSLVISALSTAMTVMVLDAFLAAVAFATLYVFGILAAVIGGLWLHLWAYFLGGKKGLNQTLKTVFYGSTPVYLLGWIPYVGALAFVWSIFLDWVGLQKLQGLSQKNAGLAVIIGLVIPWIIITVIAAYALLLYMPAFEGV